jgi:hypothetical protein
MSRLLAAAQAARTIVVERGGGTAWWIPLGVALIAAATAYYATWKFKKADVNRENAFRVADLVYEAEQIVSRPERYAAEGGAMTTSRLLGGARVRAQPLEDDDLNDRFQAAQILNVDLQLSNEEPGHGRGRYWLGIAIWNVRVALFPHLAAPRFVGRTLRRERTFPTMADLMAMPSDDYDANVRLDALVDWRAGQG